MTISPRVGQLVEQRLEPRASLRYLIAFQGMTQPEFTHISNSLPLHAFLPTRITFSSCPVTPAPPLRTCSSSPISTVFSWCLPPTSHSIKSLCTLCDLLCSVIYFLRQELFCDNSLLSLSLLHGPPTPQHLTYTETGNNYFFIEYLWSS